MYLFRILTLSFLLTSTLTAQQQYADVLTSVDSCANYLVVSQAVPPEMAEAGTFFFIHQHSGAEMETGDNENFGNLTALNGTGRYELNRVAFVSGDTIYAQFKLQHDYLTSNNSTSVTMSTPVTAPITSPMTTNIFNGSTGGILLLGSDAPLDINANLNASGIGPEGGISSIRDSECGFLTNANDYFYPQSNWRGAFKGRGIALASQLVGRETGRGPNLNGGGGGNDHNTGGGGGGNASDGGDGAFNDEPGFFNCSGDFPGLGGNNAPSGQLGISTHFIHFGGGGGAGHGNNPNPTAGGRGGGMIILYAPSITFNNEPVLSVRGENALTVNGDGGGGGGAGGTIFLETNSLSGAATYDIRGGNGGSTNNENQERCFGPGGGGSGGWVVVNGNLQIDATVLNSGGSGGQSLNSQVCGPNDNRGENGSIGLTRPATQDIQTIEDYLNYPADPIILNGFCIGSSLSIGDSNDQSCFSAQWFINTPNAFVSLAGNPDYGPTNETELNILDLPNPAIGNSVLYRLERYGANGQVVGVLMIEIIVSEGPTAAFSFVTDELDVTFTNNSSGAESNIWIFGDGLNSMAVSPTHTYVMSGTYEVSLIVVSECGNDTLTQQVTVESSAPVAMFGQSTENVCLGDTIFFYNQSSNFESITWSSADIIQPNNTADTVFIVPQQVGVTIIELCAQNGDAITCDSEVFATTDAPDYTLSTSVSGNTFNGVATGNFGTDFSWEISGVGTFMGETLTTDLPGPGVYTVTFTASNGVCDDFVEVFEIEVFAPTTVGINQNFTAGCAPLSVFFYNITEGPVDSILWTSEVAMPTNVTEDTILVSFPDAGTFTVTLTVFSPTGPQVATQEIEVFVSPTVDFTVAENSGLITTTNLSVNATSYQWDFGDGSGGSMEFEPSYQYQNTGTYEVTLNAFNAQCNRALSSTVFVEVISSVTEINGAPLEIYPNPVQGQLHINGPAGTFQLLDIQGRSIGQLQNKTAGLVTVDLAAYPAGAYLLRFTSGGEVRVVRLILE